MNYIKLIVMLFLLFLITGCTVNYNLTIDNDYKEYININTNINNEIPLYFEDMDNLSEETDKLDGYKYYSKSNNNGYTTYTATFDFDTFSKVTSCKLLFDKCELIRVDGGHTVLSTTTGTSIFYTYPEMDAINITITVTGEVYNNNADSVVNNTYVWKLTKDNASDKKIYLEFKGSTKTNNNTTKEKTEEEKTKENIIYLGVLLVVLIGLLFVIIMIRKNKYNK